MKPSGMMRGVGREFRRNQQDMESFSDCFNDDPSYWDDSSDHPSFDQ